MLTFGGFLLLGGRLGDLYGQRRMFLIGLTLFTVASLACGLANSQGVLIVARGVQGLGGAVVSAVSLSLIMNLFTEPADRAKAMGVYGFVCAAGGSIGVGSTGTGSSSSTSPSELPSTRCVSRCCRRCLGWRAAGSSISAVP
jgi:MFS family permease